TITVLAQPGFVQGAAYREGQTLQLLFQDIIGRAFFNTLHGKLVSERSGHQDEWRVNPGTSKPAHGLQAAPARQVIVAEYDVISTMLKKFGKLLKVAGNIGGYFETRLFRFPEDQLGIRSIVLEDEHP